MDRRILVFLSGNVLLLVLISWVNSRLGGVGLFVLVGGLLPVLPILYLRSASAVVCSVLTGLFADSLYPAAPFGLFTVSLVAAVLILYPWRNRFRWELNLHALVIGSVLNAGLFVVLALVAGFEQISSLAFLLRMVLDWLLSQLLIVLVGAWFFELQRTALYALGFRTEAEDAPIR